MSKQNQTRTNEADRIMARLLQSMPAATCEMDTFSRLAGIVTSRDIPTAAMECKHRPRLLINPDFIERYCQRDEHLFLLIMHELWHVILAHTSLYPRMTRAQNIAFDAIINSGLIRQFKQPAYHGFFESLNPPDQFPHLLLRPPQGWPDNPYYPADIGPEGTVRILKQLYPEPNTFRPTMPFYDEILNLIQQDMREKWQLITMPILLGDHHTPDAYKSTFLKDAMGRVIKKWPLQIDRFVPSGGWGGVRDWQVDPYTSTSQELRQAFARVLRLSLGRYRGTYERKQRIAVRTSNGNGVLPNPRDRLMPARRMLRSPATMWQQLTTHKARLPQQQVSAHIYFDVSRSMKNVLPYLIGLLIPYVKQGRAQVFQFSTTVSSLSLEQIRSGQVQTTGGTSINCVMDHIIAHHESIDRVLILTDGYTGTPSASAIRTIQDKRTKVNVVLPAESPYPDDLYAIASSITVLPSLA